MKTYVRERQARAREVFVPLAHPPGHAQVDFGEAVAVIGGVRQAIHLFCLDLPQSDAGFVKAYPAERTEAFLDGHVSAFSFLGGVPRSILYDNTKLAVARILGDGQRERTRSFAELQSHYLFLDRFGRPGKGNDKGKVEGLVGYARRNYLVPLPEVPSFAALNAHLEHAAWRGWMTVCGGTPRALASASSAIWTRCSPCRRRPMIRVIAGPRACPPSHSCATTATTTRCRPLMAIAPCWCAAMWMRW